MEKRLGRGLGSLLGGSDDPVQQEQVEPKGTTEIRLDQISENPYQPRREFDSAALDELAASIASHGVLQPIVVRPSGPGKFQLIAGERRLRASRQAKMQSIPAVVRTGVSDREMLELALVENVQRQALNPIEKAEAFRDMVESLSLSQEQVADKVGLRRSTVANHLRLLSLPTEVREAIRAGLISMGHAKALVGLAEERVLDHLESIVREGLSVREIERVVRSEAAQGGQGAESKEPDRSGTDRQDAPWVKEIEGRIRECLGTKVAIKNGPGYRGSIVIEYFNRGDLDRIIARLTDQAKLS